MLVRELQLCVLRGVPIRVYDGLDESLALRRPMRDFLGADEMNGGEGDAEVDRGQDRVHPQGIPAVRFNQGP